MQLLSLRQLKKKFKKENISFASKRETYGTGLQAKRFDDCRYRPPRDYSNDPLTCRTGWKTRQPRRWTHRLRPDTIFGFCCSRNPRYTCNHIGQRAILWDYSIDTTTDQNHSSIQPQRHPTLPLFKHTHRSEQVDGIDNSFTRHPLHHAMIISINHEDSLIGIDVNTPRAVQSFWCAACTISTGHLTTKEVSF